MGLLSRIFGRTDSDDGPVVERPLDQEARRAQLTEMDAALGELITAMETPPCPVDNPGWQGRIKDYHWAQGSCTLLQKTPVTREGLVEITAGLRPGVGPDGPPDGLEHLVPLSDRVIALSRDLETPLPSESRA